MVLTRIDQDFEALIHFTPKDDQRKLWAKSGVAMPDGSFYIRNQSDLSNAILAVGRATPNASESEVARRNSVRRHIIKRANALNLSSMIPDTWNSDGTLKQAAMLVSEVELFLEGVVKIDDFLQHFGVRGMRWGVHRSRSSRAAAASGKASTHISPDAARAYQLKTQVRTHGTHSLSNKDLQDLVTRLNLEQQHGRLSPEHVSEGRKLVSGVLKDSGKTLATQFIIKNAPKGAAFVAKKAAVPVGAALATYAFRHL